MPRMSGTREDRKFRGRLARAGSRALSGRKREGEGEEGEKSVRAPVVENSNPSIRAALRGVTRIRAKPVLETEKVAASLSRESLDGVASGM